MTTDSPTATAAPDLPGLPPPPPPPPAPAAKPAAPAATKPATKRAPAAKSKTSKPAAKKAPVKKTPAKAKKTAAKKVAPTRKQAPQAEHGAQGNPNAAAERDAQVLKFIAAKKAGRTLQEIMDKFGFERNIAYLSTYRGQKAGTIVKVGSGTRTPVYVAAENVA